MSPWQVAVVICAYTEERWDKTLAAIHSARQQVLPPSEVIVSVDHNDALERRLRGYLADVTVVSNAGPQGLSGARKTGVTCATAPIVAFLDDDAVAPPDWLACLIAPFADPDVLVTGTAVEPDWETERPSWWPTEFDWVLGCSYRGLPEVQQDVRNVFGGCMAVRRALFDTVGHFKDGIGRVGNNRGGCEETEFCIRVRAQIPTARIVYSPAVAIRHFVPSSRGTVRYFMRRCYGEGISKALVAAITGRGPALSSERAYVTRTLLTGTATALGEAARGKPGALARAGAIIAGVTSATVGYMRGRLTIGLRSGNAHRDSYQ
jgi:GT2 family glycosyltransferase